MDELIERLASSAGIDRAMAEKAIGIIFDFLLKDGPTETVQAMLDKLPGASALVAAEQANAGGGFVGMGGVMAAGQRLMAAGLSMDQVQTVTREIVAYSREHAGEDAVGEIVGSIPGLGQFV